MSSNTEKKFYITTTLPYVNSDPHIGFAMEIIRADVIARYKRAEGYEVFFNTGTDEHGAKIYENAVKQGMDVQAYVDGYAEKFKELQALLGISDIHFIRTTDENHVLAAKEMWKRCNDNGYIYKKTYQTKYCVGCELNKTDSELENGICPIHPNREIELIDEENYFFKFSAFQQPLLDFYNANPNFVIPDFRYNEIKSFVERGLEDFSISRLKEKMPWGVPVPGDNDHVMYVWFDALTSYISTLGWPESADVTGKGTTENNFDFWKKGTPVQYCGKDNLRQQSAMWQAMLMAAGLPNSKHIVIDGFITGDDGQKMSKSLGNVISPLEIIEEFKDVTDYPEEVLRFTLLHDLTSFEDGGMSLQTITTSYQAHLQNGIGNLTNRLLKLSTMYVEKGLNMDFKDNTNNVTLGVDMSNTFDMQIIFFNALNSYDTHKAISSIIKNVQYLDKRIQEEEPYKLIKSSDADALKSAEALMRSFLIELNTIAYRLEYFMPKTSAKILECINENKMPEKALFGRLP